VSCLRTSLSQFWSGRLNQVVDQPVVVEPTSAQVPRQCRSAITATAAFTCQINNTVYLNSGLLDTARKDFPAAEEPYVLAAVLGHEIGHVVQAAVKQPGYDDATNSNEISQRIEQQADCLDGVWAYSAIAAHQLDRATFVRVTNTFLTGISSNPEIATHGTPPQRAAALAKGLRNGRPQDCGLATFS
jgi:predicted metalloprotease